MTSLDENPKIENDHPVDSSRVAAIGLDRYAKA